jgi:malonyl CoA-acyl carrier protein transacylase
VSSLGVGGTNVHVVLEAPPATERSAPDPRSRHLLVLSARTPPALERASARLVEHLESEMEREARGEAVPSMADTMWTLQVGRARLGISRILVGRTRAEVVDALVAGDPQRMEEHETDEGTRSTAFLFAGGGAQYAGMARDLWEHEPRFREEVENLLGHLREGLGETALHRRVAGLLGLHGAPPLPEDEWTRPSVGLPALFVVQVAQARLWMSWGIVPSAMIGHSMGEYSAAVLAGVLRAEEALELVVLRGRLFESLEDGGMLSVPLSEKDLRPLLDEVRGREGTPERLSVAAVNGPELTVASGPVRAIEALEDELERRGVEGRRIHIDVAAHSHMLEPILAPFRERLRRAELAPPTLPFVSNLTGTWVTAAEATDPEYWVRQLRETVRFSEGLERLLEDPARVLLEVGPGRTLATLARIHPVRRTEQEIFTSLRHPEEAVEDDHFMLQVLGRLWQRGVAVDWAGVHARARRRRVPLPTYPFERDVHLVEPKFRLDAQADPRLLPGGSESRAAEPNPDASGAVEGEGRGDPRPMEDWLFQVRWVPLASTKRTEVPEGEGVDEGHLVMSSMGAEPGDEELELRPETAALLRGAGIRRGPLPTDALPRILVTDLLEWEGGSAGAHGADGAGGPVALLLRLLEVGKRVAGRVTDGTWAAGPDGEPAAELVILTRGATDGTGDPAGALAAGPVRVLAAETPGLVTRWIDLPADTPSVRVPEPGVGALLRKALSLPVPPEGSQVVAIRGGELLEPVYAPAVEGSSPSGDPAPGAVSGAGDVLRRGAVCVVTGGYGGLGLEVSRHLARTRGARLVLLGRTAIPTDGPERTGTAPGGAADAGVDPRILRAMRVIRELEAEGAEVLPLVADVTDETALEVARDRIMEAFGAVDAIFHAAGVLDDGLALFKEPASAAQVLAPKVTGTLLLDRVFRGPAAPEVVVLFSSVSAEAGLPGQFDYTAANAFLDAWARWKEAQHHGQAAGSPPVEPTRWVSVGWSAWAETGMAVDAACGLVAWPPLLGVPGAEGAWSRARSPLFDAVHPEAGRARVRLRAGRLWMLDEHRTAAGLPLIPGAGYLELIGAALGEMKVRGGGEGCVSDAPGGSGDATGGTSHAAAHAFALEDLYFLAPFFVPEGAAGELEVRLPMENGTMRIGGEVGVVGRRAPDEPWTEHVRARLVSASGGPESGGPESLGAKNLDVDPRDPTLDFEALPVVPRGGEIRQDLALGPRWSNVRGMATQSPAVAVAGDASPFEGMVELALELPQAFGADLSVHPLHAALLDNATAVAGPLLPGFGEAGSVYVPASYGRFVVHRAFPGGCVTGGGAESPNPRIRSWIGRSDVAGNMVTLQVRITDEKGTLLAEARDFVMVRLPAEELEKAAGVALEAEAARAGVAARVSAQGLPTATGLQILEAALRPAAPPHLLVTAGDPAERVATLRETAATMRGRARGGRVGKEGPAVDVAPVEAALAELDALREAAVTAHEDRPGEVRLVAHVVMDPERFATVSEIRRSLRAVLPRELVPRNIVQLDALPRTRRGAVDRRALHDPFSPADRHVPPATPSQEAIARVWGDLLGSERVGIHDNFLDIGGHSLLAMRAIVRIEKETGYRIDPIEINLLTLEQIAARIDEATPASAGAGAPSGPEDASESSGSKSEAEAAPDVPGEGVGILRGLRRFIPGGR